MQLPCWPARYSLGISVRCDCNVEIAKLCHGGSTPKQEEMFLQVFARQGWLFNCTLVLHVCLVRCITELHHSY